MRMALKKRHLLVSIALAGLVGAGAVAPAAAAPQVAASVPSVVDCADLAGADLSAVVGTDAAVDSAQVVGTGDAAYCRVLGSIGGATKFEARMPVSTWNQRYLQLGCGGMCGSISFSVLPGGDRALALTSNTFVVAATNEGHSGAWMLAGGRANELRADYGYRANHWTALAVKDLIQRYYGQGPEYSYFQGYSDGGRAAINEAQRYPDDFDGIIAGAPAIYTNEGLTAYFIWRGINGSKLDSAAKNVLAAGSMAACDPVDGVVDGQISDPRACVFDPATLACAGDAAPTCLDAEEVQAARNMYTGPITTNGGGKYMNPGGMPEGSELNWPSSPGQVPTDYGRYLAFDKDPGEDWTWEDFEFTVQTYQGLQKMAAVYNADNDKHPDLSRFEASGGKLIIWYGLADASTGQDSTLDWYAQVQDAAGGLQKTKEFARLFQVPGLYHGGGYINYQLELLPKLMEWVEEGDAPTEVIATATTPVPRTYPVYDYPRRAAYTGSGSVYDAADWTAVEPAKAPVDHFDWMGNRSAKKGAGHLPWG